MIISIILSMMAWVIALKRASMMIVSIIMLSMMASMMVSMERAN
jgi:hypothetical protein